MDWQSILEDLARLTLAMVLGGVVGYERERGHRPAGLRTHMMVCMGAALVMVTGMYLHQVYQGTLALDPARLGAQVVSGIGFLGAGSILKSGSNIRGLTTAATLWVVACIGLAVGAGLWVPSAAVTLLAFFTLRMVKRWEPKVEEGLEMCRVTLLLDGQSGRLIEATTLIAKMGAELVDISATDNGDGTQQAVLIVKRLDKLRAKILGHELSLREGVALLNLERCIEDASE